MAIRLRLIPGEGWIAVCAALSVPLPGDVYLDDGQHAALANKFARDFNDLCDQPLPGALDQLALIEQHENNNPNREWWDAEYGPGGRAERNYAEFLAAAQWQPVIEGQTP